MLAMIRPISRSKCEIITLRKLAQCRQMYCVIYSCSLVAFLGGREARLARLYAVELLAP